MKLKKLVGMLAVAILAAPGIWFVTYATLRHWPPLSTRR